MRLYPSAGKRAENAGAIGDVHLIVRILQVFPFRGFFSVFRQGPLRGALIFALMATSLETDTPEGRRNERMATGRTSAKARCED